ncbi:hypothetical protein T484DRAFT_1820318 [Baffinella frigidus]|nr:hypothetical protein T484DRAFT_1820318 [Cryptophyta sp. CCMP2293]
MLDFVLPSFEFHPVILVDDPVGPAGARAFDRAWAVLCERLGGRALEGCFTVTDTYSCDVAAQDTGDCGSFTVCDTNDPAYIAAMLEENAGTTLLVPTVVLVDDPGCFTVTDTFNGPEPSSFTVCDMNDPAYVAGMLEENAGTTLLVPTVVLVDDPGCFTVTDTFNGPEPSSFTVCDMNVAHPAQAPRDPAYVAGMLEENAGTTLFVPTVVLVDDPCDHNHSTCEIDARSPIALYPMGATMSFRATQAAGWG